MSLPEETRTVRRLAAALLEELLQREQPIPFHAAIAIEHVMSLYRSDCEVIYGTLEHHLLRVATAALERLKAEEGTDRLCGAIVLLKIVSHPYSVFLVARDITNYARKVEQAAKMFHEVHRAHARNAAHAYAEHVKRHCALTWGAPVKRPAVRRG